MKQYNSKHTAVLSTRGFYTILTICCLIIAVSAWVLWTSADDPAQTEAEAGVPIVTPAEDLPDLTADTPVMSEEEAAAPEPAEEQAPAEETPDEAPQTAAPSSTVTVSAPIFVRPASGAVITPFSGDELQIGRASCRERV